LLAERVDVERADVEVGPMTTDSGATAGGDAGARPSASPLPGDPAALEALIARRRRDLAATIDELVVRAHPREIARRSAADARSRVRSFATTPEGQPRIERLVAVVAALIALLTLLGLARSRDRGRGGRG
jgi:hypothetical protein